MYVGEQAKVHTFLPRLRFPNTISGKRSITSNSQFILKRDSFYAVVMGKVNKVNPIAYKTFPEICDDLQKCTIFW